MIKKLLLGAACTIAFVSNASATVLTGSFSLASFGGSYIGGSQTAQTATGLDFGNAFGSTGNGYGTNGTALVGNSTGSFAGLDGTTASIADISLAALANPYTANPFISFGANSAITMNFSNASYTRSALGTAITITGLASFSDGIPADTNSGTFSLSTSSQQGSAGNAYFTFTSNAAVSAVPEPASWAMMIGGVGLVGGAMRRRKVNVTRRVTFA